MSESILPPAVPLDIALANIYNHQGETVLEVDIAVKLLQGILKNNGLEKFRSVNATKVLPRIANNDNLALFYVLRHAGFYKEKDRLVCPNVVTLATISGVLDQLLKVVDYNSKIRSGEIQPSAPKIQTPIQSPAQSQQSQQTSAVSTPATSPQQNINTMNDNDSTPTPVAALPSTSQPQQESMSDDSTPTTTTPPQQQDDNNTSTGSAGTESTTKSYTTAKSVNQMTAEEKKAYVAQLMASKRAGKKA